jgi:hypothetical protein
VKSPEDAEGRAGRLYANPSLRRAYLAGIRARAAGAPFGPPYSAKGWGTGYRSAWERGYREARDGVVAGSEAGFP